MFKKAGNKSLTVKLTDQRRPFVTYDTKPRPVAEEVWYTLKTTHIRYKSLELCSLFIKLLQKDVQHADR